MIDRDKIISAWLCCNNDLPKGRCEKCPFGYGKLEDTGDNSPFWFCDIDRIADNAVTELIFSNPAIITAYGMSCLEPQSVVWIEYRDKVCITPAIFIEYGKFACKFGTSDGIVSIMNDGYDKWWRCWNDCPTKKQRKEVRWNG